MLERILTPSPNWYCSRTSDTSSKGLLGFAGRNSVYLVDVTGPTPVFSGELAGHTDRVSGFTFCHHPAQEDLCVSCSDDGTVKIWDITSGSVVKEHQVHQNIISALHWSPLVKDLIISGDEKGIIICFWYNRNDTQQLFPEPRTIFCLSCSPHHEDHVAVGYKDGMIVLIDISRKGEVIHRLRGHNDEIHALSWCPLLQNEEALYSRQEEIPEAELNGEPAPESTTECYFLASGSRDQTIRIWNSNRGKGLMTLKLPFLKRRGGAIDTIGKERLWLTVHWPPGWPTQIVSSCFGGELLLWDLTKSGKQKWTLFGLSSEWQNHSRIAFSLCSLKMADGKELLFSTSMDRDVKCWDMQTLDCRWTMPTLGGYVYNLAFSSIDVGCLAVGVGDTMIRVWHTLSLHNKFEVKSFWQGIKGKVMALSWHPAREGFLAFGTDDGKVGIIDTYSNKLPQISSSYHKKSVYTVAWGPAIPPVSRGGDGDKPFVTLYSCAGEGIILQHNPWKLTVEAHDINKLIQDTNAIKYKLPLRSEFNWKPDGKVLAIGNEDGSIEIFNAPELKLLCTIQQHHKLVNAIRWHHDHGNQPELGYLIASGSVNAVIYVHNLQNVIENPPDTPALIPAPYRTLPGHTAKITSLAWSPHHDGRLVSASYDGTAQVWDVLKEEPLCNYRGHKGRLLCVRWSPVDPDSIWTGADDFTVHNWMVSKQEFTRPPKGKKQTELELKRNSQLKPKTKKKKRAVKEITRQDFTDSLNAEENPACANEMASEPEEEETEVQDQGSEVQQDAPMAASSSKAKSHIKHLPAVRIEQSVDEKKREKPDLFLKKRKSRSILPLSTALDHKLKEEMMQDCLTLTKVCYSKEPEIVSKCIPGAGEYIHLGLFTDRAAVHRVIKEEGANHLENGHPDLFHHLMIWKGDLSGALKVASERGELTDYLVSLSSMAGYLVWVQTVEAFVKQLCFQEEYVKAACYLLAIQRVYAAVELLKSHQLYREAIVLAKARLLPEDPVLKDLYTTWAAVLEKGGHYYMAAKCYLGLDSPYDAAKVLSKKGDVASLKVAAEVALVAGEREQSAIFALRCAQELLSARDWLGAQEVLKHLESLLGQRLVFCTSELLSKHLIEGKIIVWPDTSPPQYHDWVTGKDLSFTDMLIEVWKMEFKLDSENARTALQQLNTVDYPPVTASTSSKQLLLYLSHDLTLAVLNCLKISWGDAIISLLHTVTRCFDIGNFELMQRIYKLALPKGPSYLLNKVDGQNTCSMAASESLNAFFYYGQLYEFWWNQSSVPCEFTTLPKQESCEQNHSSVAIETPEVIEAAADVKENTKAVSCSSTAGEMQMDIKEASRQQLLERVSQLENYKVLLSDLQAYIQSIQREIKDIQDSMVKMVLEHKKNLAAATQTRDLEEDKEGQTEDTKDSAKTEIDACLTPVDSCSSSTGDFPSVASLTEALSELHKRMAEIPEDSKRFPFPDVLECCLVLLHIGSHHPFDLPADVQQLACDLLQKYGKTGTFLKARQRFFT
ncbi:gem-associated protein 5 isoform X2 [Protopterus annectens]|uniref:gem-associated protein 5 isoform X2 n=1 Tax=Protopterus annectens TaxID=7888 RepID=UPI001CFBA0D3|nr:gem-associated protein 5 isoform X2 [Protopterus annectens]